eukprot:scaffold31669_cov31-Phaeocystis_antarctica.AAC.1
MAEGQRWLKAIRTLRTPTAGRSQPRKSARLHAQGNPSPSPSPSPSPTPRWVALGGCFGPLRAQGWPHGLNRR